MIPRTRFLSTLDGPAGPPRILLVGDSHAVAVAATELASEADVCLVTDHEGVAGRTDDIDVTVGDVTDIETLAAADAAAADSALIALEPDRKTLLVAQLLRARFDVESTTVLVDDPRLREAFEPVASTIVAGGTVLARELCREATVAVGPEVDT